MWNKVKTVFVLFEEFFYPSINTTVSDSAGFLHASTLFLYTASSRFLLKFFRLDTSSLYAGRIVCMKFLKYSDSITAKVYYTHKVTKRTSKCSVCFVAVIKFTCNQQNNIRTDSLIALSTVIFFY